MSDSSKNLNYTKLMELSAKLAKAKLAELDGDKGAFQRALTSIPIEERVQLAQAIVNSVLSGKNTEKP